MTKTDPLRTILEAEQLLPLGHCLVPPMHLRAADDNLRQKLNADSDEWKIFVESIRNSGVLVPLIVTPARLIVAGHRRQSAAIQAKVELVPVVVAEYSELERQIVMICENLMRVDINPMEEAAGYLRCSELGLAIKDLAGRVGRTQKHVGDRLALLELPLAVQKRIGQGSVTLSDAQDLARLVKAGFKGDVSTMTGWQAKEKINSIERKKKIDKELAALKKKGVNAVASAKKGWAQVDSYRRGFGWNPDQKKAHAALVCHAVRVEMNSWDPKPKPVGYCSDPATHFDGSSSLQADTDVYAWDAGRKEIVYAGRSGSGATTSAGDWQRSRQVEAAKDQARQVALDQLHNVKLTVADQHNIMAAVVLTMIRGDQESDLYLSALGLPLPPHEVDGDDRALNHDPFDQALRDWVTVKPARALTLATLFLMGDDRLNEAQAARDVILAKYAGLDLEAAEAAAIEELDRPAVPEPEPELAPGEAEAIEQTQREALMAQAQADWEDVVDDPDDEDGEEAV